MAKIELINGKIARAKERIATEQARIKDLERQRTELENAEYVAIIRGYDIRPEDIKTFAETYKKQQAGAQPTPAITEEQNEE